ncbi:hypothetical protein [Aquibacillus rhizosphaerae]|uniref:Uncharacterized protein n=1 Tax=Aquibacillus rhizosphaerae TaxID=3051431 RepID=A0ABT7L7X9_9BACI|nr:hypothetical protein [Aquibacillus sp. LR5S19]MDL4841974.1 hypothetical protein [Aquibacillus sp. LR5S19]
MSIQDKVADYGGEVKYIMVKKIVFITPINKLMTVLFTSAHSMENELKAELVIPVNRLEVSNGRELI